MEVLIVIYMRSKSLFVSCPGTESKHLHNILLHWRNFEHVCKNLFVVRDFRNLRGQESEGRKVKIIIALTVRRAYTNSGFSNAPGRSRKRIPNSQGTVCWGRAGGCKTHRGVRRREVSKAKPKKQSKSDRPEGGGKRERGRLLTNLNQYNLYDAEYS